MEDARSGYTGKRGDQSGGCSTAADFAVDRMVAQVQEAPAGQRE